MAEKTSAQNLDQNLDQNIVNNSLTEAPQSEKVHIHSEHCGHHHTPTTFERDRPKLGRNDPCQCGSGKKYKKCCI